jgi:DNA-binding NarL/FixJ family response regulator
LTRKGIEADDSDDLDGARDLLAMPVAARGRIVLAQPHELVLEALGGLLEDAGLSVVASCASLGGLHRWLRVHAADVVLLDEEFAPRSALGAIVERVRAAASDCRVVLLVSAVDPATARETVALEVDGVVLKSASSQDVVAALRRVIAGDAIFPADWLAAAHRAELDRSLAPLSDRQREVLELLAEGLPNASIAERLYISKNTVKFHVATIYARLGVRNRVHAVQALTALRAEDSS